MLQTEGTAHAQALKGEEACSDTGGPGDLGACGGGRAGSAMVLDRGRGQAVQGSAGHGEVCFILSATEGNDEITHALKIIQEIFGKFYVTPGPKSEKRLLKVLKNRKDYLTYPPSLVIKNKNTPSAQHKLCIMLKLKQNFDSGHHS